MGRKKTVGQRRKNATAGQYKKQQPRTERIIPNNLQYPSPDVAVGLLQGGEEEDPDMTVTEFLSKKDKTCEPTIDASARRIAIAYTFELFGAPEETIDEPWLSKGNRYCLGAKVKQMLNLPHWADTSTVFRNYLDCKASGIKYTGQRSQVTTFPIGRPPSLSTDSIEAQICADTQEEGFSVSLTWHAINQHRRESCMPSVTKSVVLWLIKQLKQKISFVRKVSQGNRDPSSHWAVARWLFSNQFLIRLGIIDSQENSLTNIEDGSVRTFVPEY